jgi:hypothetical protein
MKLTVFWDVVSCSLVEVTDVSEVLTASIIALIMEAASTSETSLNFYQHYATSQNTVIFKLAAVRTSNLTENSNVYTRNENGNVYTRNETCRKL